jgi:hypothetical protein
MVAVLRPGHRLSSDQLRCSRSVRDEKVQVAAAIRLKDVRGVKARIASPGNRRRPIDRAAPLEFDVIDEQVEAAARGVEADAIAVRTSASGPPAAASATRRITVPHAVPPYARRRSDHASRCARELAESNRAGLRHAR